MSELSVKEKDLLIANAELESDKSRMMDAMHAAVALNSAGINLTDFDECVLRLHEWSALPVYCIALYVDFIHGFISENRLLDFGYINDNGAFAARQEEKRNAELVEALEKEKGYASAYEAEKWHYHGLAESEGERANRAEARLEAAEKRIAELESRRVALPKEYVCYHGGPCGDDFREPCYLKDSVLLMLKSAGIECEVV